MPSVAELQEKAIAYARNGDFGLSALEMNQELTRLAPSNEGAWTRLGRCHLELGQLDEATAALESALRVNPQNTIARNLLMEVTKRRSGAASDAAALRVRASTRTARTRTASARPIGGFGRPEFAALGSLPAATALEALASRIEPLLMALNDRPFAARVVEARNRAGHSGSRLFRRNSFYPGSAGHVFAFHHGGRWEPQLNLGLFAAGRWGRDAFRAGIGFDATPAGADAEADVGQERVLEYFARFQRLISAEWRQLLIDWMGANGGFIQYADRPAATDMLPREAVPWLIDRPDAREVGWIFCGRWLFADRADDARMLADAGALSRWIDQTFQDLLPLWSSVYRG